MESSEALEGLRSQSSYVENGYPAPHSQETLCKYRHWSWSFPAVGVGAAEDLITTGPSSLPTPRTGRCNRKERTATLM